MRANGLELGSFLTWFIRTELPPAYQSSSDTEAGKPSGGVSLLAWSYGNCVAFSMFAYADLLPVDDQEVLARYLRSYILFGESVMNPKPQRPDFPIHGI